MAGINAASNELFPIDLPTKQWVQFNAVGFSAPVHGVVYRLGDQVTNGLALGGIDTGERTFGNDYYQDMMLWSLPAAVQARDWSWPARSGGLVNRILAAARDESN